MQQVEPVTVTAQLEPAPAHTGFRIRAAVQDVLADALQYRGGRTAAGVLPDPEAQCIALPFPGQCRQAGTRDTVIRPACSGQVMRGQRVEQRSRLGLVCRTARQVGTAVRPAAVQLRHDPVAQEVAGKGDIRVAGVLDPVQPPGIRVGGQRGARRIQQGAQVLSTPQCGLRRHGSQAVHTAAAQQLQQQGLGLVILVMGGQQAVPVRQPVGQCGIARRTRRGLRALPGPGTCIDAERHIRDIQCPADLRTVRLPGGRMHLQAMVDMHGAHRHIQPLTQCHQRMQQHV